MNAMQDTISKYFPNALDGHEATQKYVDMLRSKDIDPARTLMATSLCADDINVTSTGFASNFHGPFVMGGLGGLPFAGNTGMTAFAHHIPDEGTAFVFYGPHVGVNEAGELGRMRRPGQSQDSASCGALMLALKRIKEGGPGYRAEITSQDYQQAILENKVAARAKEILDAPNQVKAVTDVAYDAIHDWIWNIFENTQQEFHCKNVVMLGGVIINRSPEQGDLVDVRHFDIVTL